MCLSFVPIHAVMITAPLYYTVFFFLKITLVVQGLLWFYINFRIVKNISVKNVIEILIDVALNL